jgi:hypothetical protein
MGIAVRWGVGGAIVQQRFFVVLTTHLAVNASALAEAIRTLAVASIPCSST